jgi:hypothetical protein
VCGESSSADAAFCSNGHLFPAPPSKHDAPQPSRVTYASRTATYGSYVEQLRANTWLMWGVILYIYILAPMLFVSAVGQEVFLGKYVGGESAGLIAAALATYVVATIAAGWLTKKWGFALLMTTFVPWHFFQWGWFMNMSSLPDSAWGPTPWLKSAFEMSWMLPTGLVLIGVLIQLTKRH